MADYFAVLQRTLAGFEAPQLSLREKLYERARLTIRRQLDARSPALDESAISTEMDRLEKAIADIENEYGGDAQPQEEAPVVPAQDVEPVEVEPEVEPASVEPDPVVEPPVEAAQPPVVDEPEEPETTKLAAEPPIPSFEPPEANPVVLEPEEPEVSVDPVDPVDVPPVEEPASPEVEPDDPIAEALEDFTRSDTERKAERAVQDAVEDVWRDLPVLETPEAVTPTSEPVDNAANDAVEAALAQLPSFDPEPPKNDLPPPPIPVTPQAPQPPEAMAPVQPESVPELERVDFSDPVSDELAIPPAPGLSGGENGRKRKSRWLLWLLLLLLLLGGIAAAGVIFKDTVMSAVGLGEANVTAVPTKVKTIKVSPDPQPGVDGDDTSEVAPETNPIAPDPEPKSEARLTEDGEEVSPPSAADNNAAAEATTQTPDPATAVPIVTGPKAFLYEEDATSGTSNVNNGSVTWSIVQEAPAPGQAEEPAIRAQIEIPERKAVLIMTLKRNADPGLSASHIFELIFAVPDDFSGGSVDEINRIVMKESEEGRGETLTASAVKISEGIFLVALDNVEAARAKNVDLLRGRSWIDLPVQYRTGRRALVTLEKGEAGEKVFEEVFAAWDKIAGG